MDNGSKQTAHSHHGHTRSEAIATLPSALWQATKALAYTIVSPVRRRAQSKCSGRISKTTEEKTTPSTSERPETPRYSAQNSQGGETVAPGIERLSRHVQSQTRFHSFTTRQFVEDLHSAISSDGELANALLEMFGYDMTTTMDMEYLVSSLTYEICMEISSASLDEPLIVRWSLGSEIITDSISDYSYLVSTFVRQLSAHLRQEPMPESRLFSLRAPSITSRSGRPVTMPWRSCTQDSPHSREEPSSKSDGQSSSCTTTTKRAGKGRIRLRNRSVDQPESCARYTPSEPVTPGVCEPGTLTWQSAEPECFEENDHG